MQHSPKPWDWRSHPGSSTPALFAGDVLILQASDFPFNEGDGVGNAHIINAAPDLYDALKALVAPGADVHAEDCGTPMEGLEGFILCTCGWRERLEAALVAIAKAEGDMRWTLVKSPIRPATGK